MLKKTFDRYLDVRLVSSRRGYCKVKLNLKPHHLNHGGIAHGGVIATLCDIALASAVGTLLKKEEWCVTATLNIYFLNPAFPSVKPIYGIGRIVRRGKTLAFVEGKIETSDKTQIASASGIWAIKSGPTKKIKTTTKRMD